VLSHALWRGAFGGDEAALGRSVRLDGRSYTIAGVLPPSFRLHLRSFPGEIDVYKVPDDWWQNGDVWSADTPEFGILRVVGRLAPGASLAQARDQLAALSLRQRESRATWERVGLALQAAPLHDAVVGSSRDPLVLLSGAVGLVLLIACANVASLLLLRSEARRREIALRMALGAGRARIVRLLLAESLWLAALGGGLGLALGVGATRLLSRLPLEGLPRASEATVDSTALAFALAASVFSTLLFGLAPAWRAARRDPASELGGARVIVDAPRLRANQALVVGQLAVSLVLLVGAALLVSSLARLQRVDPGFDPKGALTFSVSAPGTRYERPLGTDRFFRALEERVRRLPGVEAAGVVWPLPLSGRVWSNQYSAGVVAEAERAYAEYRLATAAYFDTAGIRLLEGRLFRPDDRAGVVVVSRKLAQRCWPRGRAVGQKLRALPWGPPEEWFEVVGVVDDVRNASLREPAAETLYFDSRGWSWTDWEVSYVVRASVPPGSLVPAIRAELARLDAEVPLAEVRQLSELVDQQLAPQRLALALVGVFAATAASLAIVGLYGVVSYSVSRRRREVGIRVALGADRRRILAMVLGQSARLAIAGVSIGLAAAVAVTRLLGSLLYGVSPFEPGVVIATAAGLALLALGAAVGPARSAAALDPATTLRSE
jgi:predicted permease